MNDTTALATKVKTLIETHRNAYAQGIVTKAAVDAGNEACAIGDKLVKALYPHMGSFDELLDKAMLHGYVPTLRGPLAEVLADIYDYAQECGGSKARAFRRVAPESKATPEDDRVARAILQPPKRLPKVLDRVVFERGMYGEWQGTVSKVYVGRAGRTLKNKGEAMLDICYAKKKGGTGVYRGVPAKSVTLVATNKPYDLE